MTIFRRNLIRGLVATGFLSKFPPIPGLGISRAEQMLAQIPTVPTDLLQLRPPKLDNPRVINLTEMDVKSTKSIELHGKGVDWIINIMEPLRNKLTIHGKDEARHIVIIGGEIIPDQKTDLTKMTRNGDFAVYALRGFTGATGGSFRVGPLFNKGPYTSSLPYDADASAIKTAIENVLGIGSCFTVSGSGVGGPWKIVPGDARLGRVDLDISRLEGAPKHHTPLNYFNPAEGGLVLKQWTGTAHVEGLYVGGEYCIEGSDIQNQNADAICQFANCHFEASYFQFHPDWQHGDGLQCYLGPTELRAERCDFITRSTGSGLIAQPREVDKPSKLDDLRDWWFKDCFFAWRPNLTNSRINRTFIGAPIIMEDDWPHNAENKANWKWRMSGCYASREDYDSYETVDSPDLSYFSHFPHRLIDSIINQNGITLRAIPPSGIFADKAKFQCGSGYRAPGYGGSLVEAGTKRLEGEQKYP